MSRASTPEAQRSTQPSPLGMPRSQTIDSRISQSRTPTAAAVIESGSQLQGSGSSIGIARSRTQEDFRKIDENFDEDFFEEQIDFRSMLEVGMKKREKREEREEGKKTKTKEEGMKEQEEIETAKEVTDDYDSSPYDSDASDGIIDPDNPLYKIECPSYEDFIQSTMNIEVKVTNVEGETVIPEENPIT